MSDQILNVRNLDKSFAQPDGSRLLVLDQLSLSVNRGTITAITGVSGSGKSTLLHLIGSLDSPDLGEILFNGKDIFSLSEKERANYRNMKVGFLYQFHYLMPELNVLENVAFPSLMKEFDLDKAFVQAEVLLKEIGLKDKIKYMPAQLSGGERQRVAIARSLINSPQLLLADEPTGNLDWKTGERVFNLFRELIIERDLTAIIVTHNELLTPLMDYSYHLHEGKLKSSAL